MSDVTGIGGCVLIVAYGQVVFWLITSYRQSNKIRVELLKAVLRQNIGWFDTKESGSLATRLSEYVQMQILLNGGFFCFVCSILNINFGTSLLSGERIYTLTLLWC
jgi:ABC-type multidrug transport system fused ATPase/permease subunit